MQFGRETISSEGEVSILVNFGKTPIYRLISNTAYSNKMWHTRGNITPFIPMNLEKKSQEEDKVVESL